MYLYIYVDIIILTICYKKIHIYIYMCTHMLHEWDMCQNSHPKSASHVGTSTIRKAIYIHIRTYFVCIYIYMYIHIRQTKL